MQCGGIERRQLFQGLLRRAGKYRADELAAKGQPATGRRGHSRAGCEAAGDRLSRSRLVGRAPAGRSHRRRQGPQSAARGAGRSYERRKGNEWLSTSRSRWWCVISNETKEGDAIRDVDEFGVSCNIEQN